MKNEAVSSLPLRSLLKRIGLDEREAEVYLTLLSLKRARASDIAKASRQSRSHAYLILRDLQKKGLVSELEEEKILMFIAEPPQRLLSYLEDREQESRELQLLVEGALPLLSSLTAPYIGSPRVTVLKGLEGVKQTYRDILAQQFVGIYNPQTSYDSFGGNIVTRLFGDEVKLRGRDLHVDNDGSKRYIAEVKQHEEYEIRLLPRSVIFNTDTIVFGDSVALFAFDDEKTIVRIENKNLADAFRAWFEMLWGISRETKC
ncbi:MAG TPA: helix-turn-helix domain-containing protein [Candidatus Peribacterales bacterium]|nr:helix-turn-helix domain-containing protein [Candidatus Peribacterales bacterium]